MHLASLKYRSYYESIGAIPDTCSIQEGDVLYLKSGSYSCEKLLGKGGFGLVYKIVNDDGNPFAIKILDLSTKDPKDYTLYKKRFLQGYDIGRIKSQNLVSNYFHGELMGNPYIIMEYCSNGNLRALIGKQFTPLEIDQVGRGILSGLCSLHNNGIVHRDLKPENILFDLHLEPKLSDYDISVLINNRQTFQNWYGKASQVWGTLPYAAPEQLDLMKGLKATTFAADVFSFGVTMYELITQGCLPYGSFEEVKQDPEKYYYKIKKSEFIPVSNYNRSVNPNWVKIIHKCIAPNLKNRYTTALEVYSDLPYSYTPLNSMPTADTNVAGVWILTITNGSDLNKIFNLNELIQSKSVSFLTLGNKNRSDEPNDINLNDINENFISRKHATLIFSNGVWKLKDGQEEKSSQGKNWKKSTNGVYVNSYFLKDQEEYVLKDRDVIFLSETTSLQVRIL